MYFMYRKDMVLHPFKKEEQENYPHERKEKKHNTQYNMNPRAIEKDQDK